MPGQDIYLTAWQDNKPVHMLSTIKPFLQKFSGKVQILDGKDLKLSLIL